MEQETRYQRIAREQRERQEARAKGMKPDKATRKRIIREERELAARDTADHIDGYDRDDLGLSPDY